MKLQFRLILFSFILIWFFASLAPLLKPGRELLVFLFPFFEISFSSVCHQDAAKLICNGEFCSFLCARCIGIYFGVLLISFYTIIKPKFTEFNIIYLLLFSLPMFADVIFAASGFYTYSKVYAFLTGMIFGAAAFYYFYIGIQDFSFFKTKV